MKLQSTPRVPRLPDEFGDDDVGTLNCSIPISVFHVLEFQVSAQRLNYSTAQPSRFSLSAFSFSAFRKHLSIASSDPVLLLRYIARDRLSISVRRADRTCSVWMRLICLSARRCNSSKSMSLSFGKFAADNACQRSLFAATPM